MIVLWPDIPDIYYNIACIFARQDRVEDAVVWLKKAIKRGYKNWNVIKTDRDLDTIRGSSYYKDLIRGR